MWQNPTLAISSDLGRFSNKDLNTLQALIETLSTLDLMSSSEAGGFSLMCTVVRFRRSETSRLYYGQYYRNQEDG